MSSPAVASISNRLTSAQSQLLERGRVISLGILPAPSATHALVRSLTALRSDITKLEDEAELEAAGLVVGKGAGSRASSANAADLAAVEELGERYDRLVEMLRADDTGRERAKTLVRERRVHSPQPDSDQEEDVKVSDMAAHPPAPAPAPSQSLRPFKDYDDNEEEGETEPDMSHHEVLSTQRRMMEDQDEHLNLLSHSINRQNHLSVRIGEELDIHHDLLEDTEAGIDRTAANLGRARRRLNHFADNAKQHGSTITIVALIVILLLLIIVFKT